MKRVLTMLVIAFAIITTIGLAQPAAAIVKIPISGILNSSPSASDDSAVGAVDVYITAKSVKLTDTTGVYVTQWTASSQMYGFQQGTLNLRTSVTNASGGGIDSRSKNCSATTYCTQGSFSGTVPGRYTKVCVQATGSVRIGPYDHTGSSGRSCATPDGPIARPTPSASRRAPNICGSDHLHLLYYNNQTGFKVTAVDLGVFLPASAPSGLLEVAWKDNNGYHSKGGYGVSRYGGGSTPVLSVSGKAIITATLLTDDGDFICSQSF